MYAGLNLRLQTNPDTQPILSGRIETQNLKNGTTSHATLPKMQVAAGSGH